MVLGLSFNGFWGTCFGEQLLIDSLFSRSRIILRAASLVATKYRYETLALCMLGQSKTAQQADIDAVAELIDFLKFNVVYGQVIWIFNKNDSYESKF